MKRLKISKNGVKQAFKIFISLTVIWGVYALVQLNRQVTVKDIAFDNILSIINKLDGYTVYLKEKGGYDGGMPAPKRQCPSLWGDPWVYPPGRRRGAGIPGTAGGDPGAGCGGGEAGAPQWRLPGEVPG